MVVYLEVLDLQKDLNIELLFLDKDNLFHLSGISSINVDLSIMFH